MMITRNEYCHLKENLPSICTSNRPGLSKAGSIRVPVSESTSAKHVDYQRTY